MCCPTFGEENPDVWCVKYKHAERRSLSIKLTDKVELEQLAKTKQTRKNISDDLTDSNLGT